MGSIIRSTGTIFYSLSYSNSRNGFNRLKHVYSIISVIVHSLPGNTINRESTRSWTVSNGEIALLLTMNSLMSLHFRLKCMFLAPLAEVTP